MRKFFKKTINKRPNKKRRVIFALIALILVCVVIFIKPNAKETVSTPEPVEGLLNAGNKDEDIILVVEKFGPKYDAAMDEVQNSDINKWDKAMLDKAYLSLLYADKIGAFSQVQTVLSLLEAVKSNGLNIDDNSYAINQEKRDEILNRANALLEKAAKE